MNYNHYVDSLGGVFGYPKDGSQDQLIGNKTLLTDDEFNAHLASFAPDEIRQRRNGILVTVVDPLVSNGLRWAELTADKQAEWSAYRTALLNVTQQDGFPHSVIWPTQPT
jgi:hypothetical protein